MLKTGPKKAQAATELAVFGAILIFLIGTIVRTAEGNSYTQNENFKAMRLALLDSWQGTIANPGKGQPQNTSHNSASILFLEDRLSPDSKYGDLDRIPFMASGSGTFSYNLEYPISDAQDIVASLPIMDVYINGQHFPLTMASYNSDYMLQQTPNSCTAPAGSCQENKCLRNQREWVGGSIQLSSFDTAAVSSTATVNPDCTTLSGAAQRECQQSDNACTIFTDLAQAQIFTSVSGNQCASSNIGIINQSFAYGNSLAASSQWAAFTTFYQAAFPNNSAGDNTQYLNAILQLIQANAGRYKLFYTWVPNSGGTGSTNFILANPPPGCSSTPSKDNALCAQLPLYAYDGSATVDGSGASTNANGVMQFDLLRNADYSSTPPTPATPGGVYNQFPPPPSGTVCSTDPGTITPYNRCYVAWQWAATPAINASLIGLDVSNNQYPAYDVDGRLNEVTIFNLWQDNSGYTHVAFEDNDGGDIDGTWDLNSCGPSPGLQPSSQLYTFTKNGTYLEVKEGGLFSPQTGLEVESTNKRNTIDLIQRTLQLSNNTGRFCDSNNNVIQPNVVGTNLPNPVEVCVSESSQTDNCFSTANIALTCYDTNPAVNRIFVRSRLEDRRGHSWLTATAGQLKVQ